MALSIVVLEEAENDIDESFIWYESQKEGLGNEFISYLSKAFRFISAYPETSGNVRKNVSRHVMDKFPFGVYYTIDQKHHQIRIIAVLHFKRKPSTWKKR